MTEKWQNIPQELRERPQWCLAAADKRPLTVSGGPASSTDPSTWITFDEARAAAGERACRIGYMLSADDPFSCIDLDVKDDTPHHLLVRFGSIINTIDSYTERSRSGRGYHVWVKANIGRGRKRDGVEVYSQERFIICTGDVARVRPIADRQELLTNMVSQMSLERVEPIALEGEDGPDWVLAARAVEDQGELGRLFRGEWKDRYPSQSEADLVLVRLLIPLTESPLECWRTFQLSELGKREKANRDDYARRTMALALRQLAGDQEEARHGAQIAASLLQNDAGSGGAYFHLLSDDDLSRRPLPRWLVKGAIPETGVGAIYGPSGTFKSFVALDLLAHISNGRAWFGRRVTAAPAVYVPLEGQGGIPKRVAAWRQALAHQGIQATTNMRFITEAMNLRERADRDRLVGTLVDGGWAGGVLCIDTLAQAGPGIDENTSQGMGEMISIFQELQNRLGGFVLVIHHSGKNEGAGLRGWSGLLAALDCSIRCTRGDSRPWYEGELILEKIKDGENGQTMNFTVARIALGYDYDGDPITSLAISRATNVERAPEPDEVQIATEDDEFVLDWIRRSVEAAKRPTGRSLEAQLGHMKSERAITQRRLRDALARLKDEGHLVEVTHGSKGHKWLRPKDMPKGEESSQEGR